MANLITEVYVSLDGEIFNKVDLIKDESIPMRYTTKDLQNVSKIFSPYSLNFTFKANSKNRAIFGFFGDTDVLKINRESKFITKIYVGGFLNLQGYIQLESIAYENGRPTNFTGGFTTSMTNLADRLGDDLISDLLPGGMAIDWTPKNVYELMTSKKNIVVNGVNVTYYVPLISSSRVLSYDQNYTSSLKDNVAFNYFADPTGESVIKSSELRPVINFAAIIELIKKKYNLDVVAPLDLRKEYIDLDVWCNSETMFSPQDVQLTVKKDFGSRYYYDSKNEGGVASVKKYTPTANLLNNYFTVTKNNVDKPGNYKDHFNFRTVFQNVTITGGSGTPSVNIKILRLGTDEILISKKFDLTDNEFFTDLEILDSYFIGGKIDFYVMAQFYQPTTWANCLYNVWFRYYDGKTGVFARHVYATYAYDSTPNNNAADSGGTRVDLFTSLPEVKVVDFLTSYFKMFNISVFDTSPNDDRLYWLTPEDIATEGREYSKAVLNYTSYVNYKAFNKSTSSDYNYYSFKHKTSKYRSAVDYAAAFGLEYGQAVSPLVKPVDPREFTVETSFSLIPPVLLAGSSEIVTFYGFNDAAPTILETGESRYEPNYGELTIFYGVGNTAIIERLGVQSTNSLGLLVVASLGSYMKVLPFNKDNDSLGFSVLKFSGIEYPESLYKRFYQGQTERLLDPNVLSQDYELDLPSNEIYLNEATTIQGAGLTPKGFRLQNEIIIGEDLFTILDATIDITTGKTKLTLLNF